MTIINSNGLKIVHTQVHCTLGIYLNGTIITRHRNSVINIWHTWQSLVIISQ